MYNKFELRFPDYRNMAVIEKSKVNKLNLSYCTIDKVRYCSEKNVISMKAIYKCFDNFSPR